MTLTRSLRTARTGRCCGFVLTRAERLGAEPPQPAHADKLDLTLEDAVRRAVDHNPDLAIVRLRPNAQSARVAEARGAFEPLLRPEVRPLEHRVGAIELPGRASTGIQYEGLVLVDGLLANGCSGAAARGACRGTRRGRPPTAR